MEKKSCIQLINLSKHFTVHNILQPVLNNIHTSFMQGGRYAITGVSGSGKSTLLYTLAGLDQPSSGKVLLDDVDIYEMKGEQRQKFLQKGVGLVFQKPYLIKEFSVLENCMIKGYAKKVGSDDKEMAIELLHLLGLGDKIYDPPATLSGGQQQRVAIARALYLIPRFLIADEPTAHLDQKTKLSILDLMISTCQKFGIGLIMSTHDHEIAGKMEIHCEILDGTFEPRGINNSDHRSQTMLSI